MLFNISWFGRCCFLVELNDKKILFDPYDRYCNVDIGLIPADILISSSTWHDHGHIGASPNSWIYTYPGTYENSGFTITGIEALENRGSPTVVFNLRFGDISITNFADLGAAEDQSFSDSLTPQQKAILQTTTVAMVRPSIEGEEITDHNVHNEKFLKYCRPSIIFPEHFFPESFIKEQVPSSLQEKFLNPNIIVAEMLDQLGYPVETVNSFEITLDSAQLSQLHYLCHFTHLHPQVKYIT